MMTSQDTTKHIQVMVFNANSTIFHLYRGGQY